MKKKRTSPPKFFYLGGELHTRLHVDRGGDTVLCWNYPKEKTATYSWSETRRLMRPCFTTGQVVELINRSRISIETAILNGDIRRPYQSYALTEERKRGRFMWNEIDVMEARDYFATKHIGFPRNDGRITAKAIPTRTELRAMMEHGITTYVRTSDGEFVPMFKEIVW